MRRRSLEESDRLRRALLHSVSHDLRTPLTAIRTIAAALRGAEIARAERDAMLADVEHEAEPAHASRDEPARGLARRERGAAPGARAGARRGALPRARRRRAARARRARGRARHRAAPATGRGRRDDAAPGAREPARERRGPRSRAARACVRCARAGGSSCASSITGPACPRPSAQRVFEAFQRLRARDGVRGRGTGPRARHRRGASSRRTAARSTSRRRSAAAPPSSSRSPSRRHPQESSHRA